MGLHGVVEKGEYETVAEAAVFGGGLICAKSFVGGGCGFFGGYLVHMLAPALVASSVVASPFVVLGASTPMLRRMCCNYAEEQKELNRAREDSSVGS